MSRKLFTEEQQQLLRQNPYIYSVTETRITLLLFKLLISFRVFHINHPF